MSNVVQRRPIEEMSRHDAAAEVIGQVVRCEKDRANRNNDSYSQDVKIRSAHVNALLAIDESLQRIGDLLTDR